MASYTSPMWIGNVESGADRLRHPDDGVVCRMVSKTVTATVCRGTTHSCTQSTTGCGRYIHSIVLSDTLAPQGGSPKTSLWLADEPYVTKAGGRVSAVHSAEGMNIAASVPSPYIQPWWYGSRLAANGRSCIGGGPNSHSTSAESGMYTGLVAADNRLLLNQAAWTMFGVFETDMAQNIDAFWGPMANGNGVGYAFAMSDDGSTELWFKGAAVGLGSDQVFDGIHSYAVGMSDGVPFCYVDNVAFTLFGTRPALQTPDTNQLGIGCSDPTGSYVSDAGICGYWYEVGTYAGHWTPTHVANYHAYASQAYKNTEASPRAAMVVCPTRYIQRQYDTAGSDTALYPPG